MTADFPNDTLAVLFRGGLDSAILLGQSIRAGRDVVPLFTRSGLLGQRAELAAERKAAFEAANLDDSTPYASAEATTH